MMFFIKAFMSQLVYLHLEIIVLTCLVQTMSVSKMVNVISRKKLNFIFLIKINVLIKASRA